MTMLSVCLTTMTCSLFVMMAVSPSAGEKIQYMISNSESRIMKRGVLEQPEVTPIRKKRNANYRYGFSNEEITRIVDAHNTGRQNVNPTATNMVPLVWDDTVARKAQEYACRCSFIHSSAAFRTSTSFGRLGENLYASTGWDSNSQPQGGVTSWLDEAPFYTIGTTSCAAGQMCGHYTQAVWASTRVVGCGMAECDSLEDGFSAHSYIFVCQYGPGGNYVSTPPYTTGSSCSSCPANYGGGCQSNMCVPDSSCSGYTCSNGGTLDTTSCVCTCTSGYYGAQCTETIEPNQQCSSSAHVTSIVIYLVWLSPILLIGVI